MQISIEVASPASVTADWLIVGVPDSDPWPAPIVELNSSLNNRLAQLKDSQDLTAKLAELLPLRDPQGISARRVMLVGLGAADQLTDHALLRAVVTAARSISIKKTERLAIVLPFDLRLPLERAVQAVACGLQIGSSGQDLYKTERRRHPFSQIVILVPEGSHLSELKAAADRGAIVGEAVNLARHLVNEPAKVIYPETFAQKAAELSAQYGLGCQVLDLPALQAERMGSLLAVSSGSDRPPRLVELDYNNAPAGAPVLGLVGKGVTFDSGGLSIKPNDGMLTMKCDMAGAATVLAAIVAIARLQLPVHVRAYCGLVENMTGGSAMKLGDVLHARSGTTIEVLNTDAEGRLVLADVLDYAITRGADYLIDLATLTGACVIALGDDVSGIMSNNQPWCDAVLSAAKAAGEDAWQLPMFDLYGKLIESDVADIKNVGGRAGGAITAAKFLERFVRDKPWVHADIAGPAFASGDKPHRERGGTGYFVRTLIELARDFSHRSK